MPERIKILMAAAAIAIAAVTLCSCSGGNGSHPDSTKRERTAIKKGNELYCKQRYADSEVSYKKALAENGENLVARFNLASSYLKQRGEDLSNKGDSLVKVADAMLQQVAASADTVSRLGELANYDRGNIAYKAEDYTASIEHYKQALRRNPDNFEARQNLRLAQLKKQEQEQQNQNNQDDKNQDNQEQNQDNQDQNQNQDNQNKNEDQNQDKEQEDQPNQQNQNQPKQDEKNPQKQQQGGLSDASAMQILKAMEDKENGTRQKVELMKQGEEKHSNRRNSEKPW